MTAVRDATVSDAAPVDGGLEPPVLEVEGLDVWFGRGAAERHVVQDVSFQVRPGRALALVGESGSGKSVTARALVGLAGDGSRVSARSLRHRGRDLLALRDRQWRAVRGADIGFVLQDALVSLDPLRPVGAEIEETLTLHRFGDRTARRERVLRALTDAGVPEPELRARQRPGELSGGLRQRALIASAIALDPGLLIADEPTTALDASVQAQILALLAGFAERGDALVVISHDLSVVARLADDIAVMYQGRIVEQGPTAQVLGNPRDPYTQRLLDAVPSAHRRGTRLSPGTPRRHSATARLRPHADVDATRPVLSVDGLRKSYRGPDGSWRTVVDDVSFHLLPGRTLGVVGESGSGKTTTARAVLGFVDPDGGTVELDGQPWSALPESRRRGRRHDIGVVYQDPLSSFDPRHTVRAVLTDALASIGVTDRGVVADRIAELLDQVGLEAEHLDRRPLQLSGGQRQRVAIARALAPEPRVLLCDEPVSALDVSIQAQVLDLLVDLQRDLGVSYVFISHDLGVVHHISDDVLVLKDGRVVEHGTADQVFTAPQHPYTRQLLDAVPRLDARQSTIRSTAP